MNCGCNEEVINPCTNCGSLIECECSNTVLGKCVVFAGASLSELGISGGENYDLILSIINDKLNEINTRISECCGDGALDCTLLTD